MDQGLECELQSAYKRHYSTETALLKVKNDLLMSMDNQRVTFLVLLDLSAAFDTVCHQIVVDRLHSKFRVSGTVLEWLRSYLSKRSQRVSIKGVLSDGFELRHGVPQGSCLGPYCSACILANVLTSPKPIYRMFIATLTTPSYTCRSVLM